MVRVGAQLSLFVAPSRSGLASRGTKRIDDYFFSNLEKILNNVFKELMIEILNK